MCRNLGCSLVSVTSNTGMHQNLQSGLTLLGLATTKPAPAPGTMEPLGPMLFSAPCRATAFSEATKELRSLARSSALGTARTRVPRTERREREVGKRMVMLVPGRDKGEKAHERHLPAREQTDSLLCVAERSIEGGREQSGLGTKPVIFTPSWSPGVMTNERAD